MNRSLNYYRSVLFTIALLAVTVPAAAQDPGRGDFSAGWRLLKATNTGIDGATETFPAGWYADATFNIADGIALVGDLSGAYKSIDKTETALGTTVNNAGSFKVHTFMGGLRYTFQQQPDLAPFVQVLFGLAHGSANIDQSVTVGGRTTSRSESESYNEFALDLGTGVTFAVTDRLNMRVGLSYLRIGADGGGNGLRLGVGVVYPF
jgi:opacity protein-like surface antigen